MAVDAGFKGVAAKRIGRRLPCEGAAATRWLVQQMTQWCISGWWQELSVSKAPTNKLATMTKTNTIESPRSFSSLLILGRSIAHFPRITVCVPLYDAATPDEKQQILRFLLLNCTLNDATPTATYRKPFNWLVELAEMKAGGADGI